MEQQAHSNSSGSFECWGAIQNNGVSGHSIRQKVFYYVKISLNLMWCKCKVVIELKGKQMISVKNEER